MDKETFDVMWALSAPDGPAPGCFLRIPQTEYYADAIPRPHDLEHMPDVSLPVQFLPPSHSPSLQFEYIPDDALAPETQSGIKFSTITIDTPVYLNWLLARFLAAGGRVVRGAVQHIAQLAEGGVRAFTTPHAGSRALVRGSRCSVRATS
jgi:D-amino-acid oxidase